MTFIWLVSYTKCVLSALFSDARAARKKWTSSVFNLCLFFRKFLDNSLNLLYFPRVTLVPAVPPWAPLWVMVLLRQAPKGRAESLVPQEMGSLVKMWAGSFIDLCLSAQWGLQMMTLSVFFSGQTRSTRGAGASWSQRKQGVILMLWLHISY